MPKYIFNNKLRQISLFFSPQSLARETYRITAAIQGSGVPSPRGAPLQEKFLVTWSTWRLMESTRMFRQLASVDDNLTLWITDFASSPYNTLTLPCERVICSNNHDAESVYLYLHLYMYNAYTYVHAVIHSRTNMNEVWTIIINSCITDTTAHSGTCRDIGGKCNNGINCNSVLASYHTDLTAASYSEYEQSIDRNGQQRDAFSCSSVQCIQAFRSDDGSVLLRLRRI